MKLINYLLYILSFLSVLVLAAWGTRWLMGKMGRMGGRYLKLIDSIHLGPNRGIHLVRVANRLFLVGLSDRSLGLLAEISDSDLLGEITREEKHTSKQLSGVYKDFSYHLQRFMKTPGPGETAKEDEDYHQEIPRQLGDRLNGLRNRRTRQGEEDK